MNRHGLCLHTLEERAGIFICWPYHRARASASLPLDLVPATDCSLNLFSEPVNLALTLVLHLNANRESILMNHCEMSNG